MTWLVLMGIFAGLSVLAFLRALPVRLYLLLTLVLLFLFSLRYQPSVLTDIYRYRESFAYMKAYGAEAAYERLWYVYEGSIFFYYMMVGLSYLPTAWFVPLCILATYGVALVLFFAAAERADLSRDEFSVLFIFFVCCVNFGMVFSILRFYLAYIWGFAGILLWLREGRGLLRRVVAAALMIAAVFIHSAGFMIPVIWLLAVFYRFRAVRTASLVIPLLLFLSKPLIAAANRLFGGIRLYQLVVAKYNSYIGKSYEGSLFTRTNLFYFQLLVFLIIVFAAVIAQDRQEEQPIDRLYQVFLLFTLAFIVNEVLFLRCLQMLAILTPIFLAAHKRRFLKLGVLQAGMLGESVMMLMFYSRLSTYYYL